MVEEAMLSRMARGASWVLAWRMATRLLGLVSTLVLARLLVPEDFGLVALAASFAFALEALLYLGVEDQIVRSRNPDRTLYDTAFTINLLRGLAVGGLVAGVTPMAASFFNEPRLAPILYALAASAIAAGAANIGTADFRRRIEFHLEFRMLFLPRVASVIATIAAAAVTQSHWALVLGILLHRAGVIGMGYAMHPFRPRLSLRAWRELVGVSFWTWTIGVASVARDRSDSIVVGRAAGIAEVGVYAAGVEIATVPTWELAAAASRAVMPGFADALRADDPDRQRNAFSRIFGLILLVTLPAGVGLSLVAGPLVMVLLGPRWMAAAPVVGVIAIALAWSPLETVGSAWLGAKAALRTLLAILVVSAVFRVLLLVVLTPHYGLPGAAVAAGAGRLLEGAAQMFIAARYLQVRTRTIFGAAWRPAAAVVGMAVALHLLDLAWPLTSPVGESALASLALSATIGALVYVAGLLALWLATGRPQGAEADALEALRRVRSTVGGNITRRLRLP